MKEKNTKIPNPRQIEKEIGKFLSSKFGDSVKLVPPIVVQNQAGTKEVAAKSQKKVMLDFDLVPLDLVDYLDQYVVKQKNAKTILATKICTHFKRINLCTNNENIVPSKLVGSVKSNILMIGPTGVGKTYMIKLIAEKLGVPFVKGDATKFSETGYVGGDVEDLVRDLVKEADDNIELAQYGIVYIDEIDKIASSRNLMGADISRTGVQRALLKPMEETNIELKVPHDPISMIQEMENFRKSGKRDKSVINTKNILFIMSGAFSDLNEIIQKRLTKQTIGFGASIKNKNNKTDILKEVKSEDLIEFGFESEFVGRLPIRAIFEKLNENDLYEILKNPNNPVILGKKLDFSSYGINIKFSREALYAFAKNANKENTGARGLVSSIEKTLLPFENKLPSTEIKTFPVSKQACEDYKAFLEIIIAPEKSELNQELFDKIFEEELSSIKKYIHLYQEKFEKKYSFKLTKQKINNTAVYYCNYVTDINTALEKIKFYNEIIKKTEFKFLNELDINIILEDDAINYIVNQFVVKKLKTDDLYIKLTDSFELGFKLIKEKTGKNRFFIPESAIKKPEIFLNRLVKEELG